MSSHPPPSRFSLLSAARRILEGSLGVVPGERVVLIVDRHRAELGDALAEAAKELRAKATQIVLESLGPRPIVSMPDKILDALEGAQASVLLTDGDSRERPFRQELINAVSRPGLRHAHMVGVSRGVMEAAFTADVSRVRDTLFSLRARLRPDSNIVVRSPAGTNLEIKCNPACRTIENNGNIRPGRWENLPGGELLSTPADVRGIYVANASASALDGITDGNLRLAPLELTIEKGVVRSVKSNDRSLRAATERFMAAGRNRDRVGLFSFGANVGLLEPTGFSLADQTLPGVHLSLGTTFQVHTGADWDSDAQLVLTGGQADVDLDGSPILRLGRYLMR